MNFVAVLEDGSWRYRTFERGVEAETLACGTGAVASAAAILYMESRKTQDSQLPQSVILKTSSGCTLEVSGVPQQDGALRQPRLKGEGRVVFVGNLVI